MFSNQISSYRIWSICVNTTNSVFNMFPCSNKTETWHSVIMGYLRAAGELLQQMFQICDYTQNHSNSKGLPMRDTWKNPSCSYGAIELKVILVIYTFPEGSSKVVLQNFWGTNQTYLQIYLYFWLKKSWRHSTKKLLLHKCTLMHQQLHLDFHYNRILTNQFSVLFSLQGNMSEFLQMW